MAQIKMNAVDLTQNELGQVARLTTGDDGLEWPTAVAHVLGQRLFPDDERFRDPATVGNMTIRDLLVDDRLDDDAPDPTILQP